jgi:hypothetical protein
MSDVPGFNVGGSVDPLDWLYRNLVPSRQSVAQALGAPMDGAAWAAHRMGVPLPGNIQDRDPASRQINTTLRAMTGNRTPLGPTWAPSESVPLSSAHIERLLEQAANMRWRTTPRGGLF